MSGHFLSLEFVFLFRVYILMYLDAYFYEFCFIFDDIFALSSSLNFSPSQNTSKLSIF